METTFYRTNDFHEQKLSLFPSDKNPEDFSTQTDLRAIRQIGSGENQHVTKFFAAIRDTVRSICFTFLRTLRFFSFLRNRVV